jgi:dienelactone hydrolase
MLAEQTGMRVLCAAYRLAPEHRFPAAVEDAVEAYRYLLSKGYAPGHIALCGESAGGGLCYSLCLQAKEAGLPLPGCILAISPWIDLTMSGASYATNRVSDPSMTIERLEFFAQHYLGDADRKNPLASPLFADLSGLPPSLILAAKNEIMADDASALHAALQAAGCRSQLILTPDRWHAYPLYDLREDQKDFAAINRFFNHTIAGAHKLRWLRLDNAAKIYPAARRDNWSNVFRLSATLREEVDATVLQNALDVTVRRFPSIAVRLRRGVFWYYLEQLKDVPEVREESAYPLTRMTKQETRRCAFRVIVYRKRIAVEVFHSLTDGNGALVFLKSLVAEYLQQKYGIRIPAEHGVLGRLEEPTAEELEDSFQK